MNAFQSDAYHPRRRGWYPSMHCRRVVCLSACWIPTPQVWAWRPPQPDPSTSPLGVGLETPPVDLQGMLGYHLQCMLGYHPLPSGQTDTCKNITFANYVCGQ